eukprot:scaffold5777_cov66-Attheya_sp.AAC.7
MSISRSYIRLAKKVQMQRVEKLEYRAFDWKNCGVSLVSKVEKVVSGPDSGTNPSDLDSSTNPSDSDSGTKLSDSDSGTEGIVIDESDVAIYIAPLAEKRPKK